MVGILLQQQADDRANILVVVDNQNCVMDGGFRCGRHNREELQSQYIKRAGRSPSGATGPADGCR
jgi:hypothetical protein